MDVTHLEIRAALHGVALPSTGEDLAAVARVNQAPPEVIDLLERLGDDDTFDSVEEVLDELNLDHTAIDNTTELRVALGMADGGTGAQTPVGGIPHERDPLHPDPSEYDPADDDPLGRDPFEDEEEDGGPVPPLDLPDPLTTT